MDTTGSTSFNGVRYLNNDPVMYKLSLKNHEYYYQVQCQLSLTDLEWCDFFSYIGHKKNSGYSLVVLARKSAQRHICLNYLQSRAKRVDTLYLFQILFNSRTSLFFSPSPHFNVVTVAKSTEKSCILNIEKWDGEIDRIQCNFIDNEEYIRDCS